MDQVCIPGCHGSRARVAFLGGQSPHILSRGRQGKHAADRPGGGARTGWPPEVKRPRVRTTDARTDPADRPVTLTPVKTFDQLYAELTDKAATRPAGSGTVAALDAGVHAIGKKIVEEAAEVWMAAEYEGKARTAEEISQLLYHVQVMMVAADISLDDVYASL